MVSLFKSFHLLSCFLPLNVQLNTIDTNSMNNYVESFEVAERPGQARGVRIQPETMEERQRRELLCISFWYGYRSALLSMHCTGGRNTFKSLRLFKHLNHPSRLCSLRQCSCGLGYLLLQRNCGQQNFIPFAYTEWAMKVFTFFVSITHSGRSLLFHPLQPAYTHKYVRTPNIKIQFKVYVKSIDICEFKLFVAFVFFSFLFSHFEPVVI